MNLQTISPRVAQLLQPLLRKAEAEDLADAAVQHTAIAAEAEADTARTADTVDRLRADLDKKTAVADRDRAKAATSKAACDAVQAALRDAQSQFRSRQDRRESQMVACADPRIAEALARNEVRISELRKEGVSMRDIHRTDLLPERWERHTNERGFTAALARCLAVRGELAALKVTHVDNLDRAIAGVEATIPISRLQEFKAPFDDDGHRAA